MGPAFVLSSRHIGTAPARNDSISPIGRTCGWLAMRRCNQDSSYPVLALLPESLTLQQQGSASVAKIIDLKQAPVSAGH
jgi:hypothetical protein